MVRERAERLGSATLLYAPMLWEDRGLGSILVVRSPPRPFANGKSRCCRFRRSGGDRDRERAARQRNTGGAGPADRDRRRAESHQPFSVRFARPCLQTLIRSAVELRQVSERRDMPERGATCFYFEETFGMSPEMIDFLRERPRRRRETPPPLRRGSPCPRRVETIRGRSGRFGVTFHPSDALQSNAIVARRAPAAER